ncbi:calmin [Colossoma macropomum]|uniref:calmin n=1 Tax=Colossoma macropomum TaxID=42526 RepID=UPI00186421AA|nr:calmin [Colossoma macropomum]
MAGHEWEDWFEREEFIGQISDIRVQNLQVEREVVQKRTFTRWMNLHLEKCNPPLEVHDLFRDIQDGRILMALLEELSGCRLLHAFKQSSHRIFRLNNIAKVLTFLEERNVKLVSIDAADIADGNSSIVLGLIWNIILFFQIKELTGNIKNQFPSSSSLSSIPTSSDSDTSHSSTPSDERRPSVAARDHGKAIKTLLQWVQRRTRKYGVAVQDFGKSWASGLAFLAVIKSIDPSLVDMRRALLRSSRENIEEAFRTAHYSLGIPRLLEPEDVTLDPPDEQSIMTYVSQFLEHFPGIEEDEHSDFLERSKVSARMNEPPVRNGVQRKREKSYVVKRDWVQPPPKIFISSVTEEHAQTLSPAQPQTPEDRPWASEESSVASSPSTADSRPLCRPLGLNKDIASTPSSPQPSLIDSAMDSPDSWGEMPSETAPQLQQSCSDGSLSDLRYSTSPGELTSDQGSPLLSERVSQDQVDTDLFTDEGNFSLSSMESLQAKSTLLSEEEDAYRYILDLKEDGPADNTPSEDIVNDPNAQQTETSPVQNPETVKPAFHEHSCGDSDSGYYPGQKDISTTGQDDVSKSSLFTDADEQVSGFENPVESQSEHCEASSESSITGDFQKVSAESNPVAFFEDDAECPVLKYERISISGSEEDVDAELSEETPRNEETEENDAAEVFNSGTRTNEDNEETREAERAYLREAEEVDQVLHLDHDHQESAVEPEEDDNREEKDKADQLCSELELSTDRSLSGAAETEAEIQREEDKTSGNEDSGMCDEPVMKDLSEARAQAANSLDEMNFIEVEEEKLESSVQNQSSENEKLGEKVARDEEPSQDNMSSPQGEAVTESRLEDEPNGGTSCHEIEPSTCEDAAIGDEKSESGIEKVEEEEAPCNQHDDDESKLVDLQVKIDSIKEEKPFLGQHLDGETKLKGQQNENVNEEKTSYSHNHAVIFEDAELSENKNDHMQKSENPQDDVLVSNISETLKEPNSDPAFHEENEHSFTPPTPSSPASQPDWDQSAVNQPCDEQSQGQATWEETGRIMGTPDRAERYPAELRLSLSVTPLQPAPSQLSHIDSDSERAMQEKAGEGCVESPEQSPFELWSRHPGEWGAVDSDLHTDHCELISSDEELSASATVTASAAAARENTETLREEAAGDGAEDESQPSTALCLEEAFDPNESKTENGKTTDAIMTKNATERKESSPAGSSESSCEVALSEIYLLLLMWLLLYCLFILPQIDIWAIPSLLLNLEE